MPKHQSHWECVYLRSRDDHDSFLVEMTQPAYQAFPFGFGAKKDRGTGFTVLAAREMKEEPKNESGRRGKGTKDSFLSSPPPPRSFS